MNSRIIGDYPVIGIRPTIDGRRGPLKVRESLEDQTMNMAKAAAKLISDNLRYSNGEPVKVIIADTTIGRVAEAAQCAAKFKRENVDITLTVTPCWCYGSETMDTDPMTIKGVWGFNGTERPGAVYLASVLASHAQKGLPAFGIYGQNVQDMDDASIPDDVKEKILRFARAAIAVATMRGRSYLQIGSICMGIAGSIINCDFFEEYLGMRVESVDEVEIIRRMTEGIYDEAEFQKALAWTKEHCKEGFDKNPEELQKSREKKDEEWEFVVKMMCIIKDLFNGNRKLPEGRDEEMVGHNAIAGGFQGQRQWTDFYPNCDFPEAMLNSSFDWNGAREPYILATENDTLNGVCMLFGKLLSGRAQIFADVRTCWNTDSVKRVTGYSLTGKAKAGIDVSKWNGEIDWDKVKNAGVEFAIIRAGYRGSVTGSLVVDPCFETNIRGAAASGMPVGVYFFTQAINEVEAVEEASAVIRLIQDYSIDYPVFIDTEGAGGNGRADGLDVETRTLICEAFCRTIENAGYRAGVYGSRNWYNNRLQADRLEQYTIWLAEYRSVPLYQGYYQMWQYTSKGKVDGISGNVDLNISYY